MSVEDDPMQSLGLSTDASANINEDITWMSEYLEGSPRKASESVFSNFRGSLDGSNIMNAFNILKQGASEEDEKAASEFAPLGPNSIFELTVASDVARVRLNRGLKHQVTVNGGATTVYNLTKPSIKDIPQIQLHSLKKKVTNAQLTGDLVTDVADDYKVFELSYRTLTEETLKKFSGEQTKSDSDSDMDSDSDEIPAIFEDTDFRLDDPRVFREVMENAQILPDPESAENTHILHNTAVQEKISKYLDIVEVELIREISKTSDLFFSTLGDIQSIKGQSAECLDQFRGITKKMLDVDEGQAKAGLRILDMLDERRSVNHLESSVFQIKAVLSNFSETKALFAQGRNNECLNRIIVIENLILGVERDDYSDPETLEIYPKFEYPLVKLSLLPALRGLLKEMHQLKHSCSQGYIKNFVDLLLENLRLHYTSVPARDTMNRIYVSIDRSRKYLSATINRLYTTVDSLVKQDLQHFITNLSKSGHLVQAFDEYQDKIIAEVKAIIRNGLPESNKDSSVMEVTAISGDTSRASSYPPGGTPNDSTPMASAGGTLSSNIKSLSGTEFNSMMEKIYANLSECLRRLTIHQKLLLDLSLSSLSPALSQLIDVMALDITTAINKAIELTQIRLVKVLNVRLEQLGDLLVPDYLHLYLVSSAYLLECEFINPGYNATGPGSSLGEWVKNHIAYYLHRFHSNSIKRFAAQCDKETWRECTSASDIQYAQTIVDQLVGYSKFINTEGKEGFDGVEWLGLLDFYASEVTDSESEDNATLQNSENTKLEVNKKGFLVPPLVLSEVANVRDYVIISKVFSSRATLVGSNLLTYFKVVNSRISQAILNAGATRTAGLKHITTKHLALCIQTIEFHIALLEAMQFTFKNQKVEFDQSNPASEEQTFSNTIGNYKDHEKELFSKLVSIMYDRTLSHCTAITKLDLSTPVKHPQQCHQYMSTLVKETTTVAKVLSKYLPETECSFLLLQIFDNYKKLMVNCICTELPQFKDFNEKHSLLKDVDYFRVKLSEIPGYGNSGQVIWENVNSLPTIEDARMDQVMRNNIEGERAAAAAAAASARNSTEIATQEKLTEKASDAVLEEKPLGSARSSSEIQKEDPVEAEKTDIPIEADKEVVPEKVEEPEKKEVEDAETEEVSEKPDIKEVSEKTEIESGDDQVETAEPANIETGPVEIQKEDSQAAENSHETEKEAPADGDASEEVQNGELVDPEKLATTED